MSTMMMGQQTVPGVGAVLAKFCLEMERKSGIKPKMEFSVEQEFELLKEREKRAHEEKMFDKKDKAEQRKEQHTETIELIKLAVKAIGLAATAIGAYQAIRLATK